MKNYRFIFLFLTSVFPITATSAADFVLISNAKLDVHTVSKDELRDIYLGKASHLGGKSIKPIRQETRSPVSNDFLIEVVDMSSAKFQDYWRRKLFSGQGLPPKQVSSDAKMLESIESDQNAIGYVSSETKLPSGVKRVKVQ